MDREPNPHKYGPMVLLLMREGGSWLLLLVMLEYSMWLSGWIWGNIMWGPAAVLLVWYLCALKFRKVSGRSVVLGVTATGEPLVPERIWEFVTSDVRQCNLCGMLQTVRTYRVIDADFALGLPSRTIRFCVKCRELVALIPAVNAVVAALLSLGFSILCLVILGTGAYISFAMVMGWDDVTAAGVAIALILIVVSLLCIHRSIDFAKSALNRELPLHARIDESVAMP